MTPAEKVIVEILRYLHGDNIVQYTDEDILFAWDSGYTPGGDDFIEWCGSAIG